MKLYFSNYIFVFCQNFVKIKNYYSTAIKSENPRYVSAYEENVRITDVWQLDRHTSRAKRNNVAAIQAT